MPLDQPPTKPAGYRFKYPNITDSPSALLPPAQTMAKIAAPNPSDQWTDAASMTYDAENTSTTTETLLPTDVSAFKASSVRGPSLGAGEDTQPLEARRQKGPARSVTGSPRQYMLPSRAATPMATLAHVTTPVSSSSPGHADTSIDMQSLRCTRKSARGSHMIYARSCMIIQANTQQTATRCT